MTALLGLCLAVSWAAAPNDRDALLGRMDMLMADMRPALKQLQDLQGSYASASRLGDIPSQRKALWDELIPRLQELGAGQQEFLALNKGELYRRGMQVLGGKDHNAALATFLVYEDEPRKIGQFIQATWASMKDEAVAFEELQLRLQVRRQRWMALTVMAAVGGLGLFFFKRRVFLLLLLAAFPAHAAKDDRVQRMEKMRALLSDLRPLVFELEELRKGYPAAQDLKDIPGRREALRGRLQQTHDGLWDQRKQYISVIRDDFIFGTVTSLPSIAKGQRGKADSAIGNYAFDSGEMGKIRTFCLDALQLLLREEEDFKALQARLEAERAARRHRRLMLWGGGALAAACLLWGLLGFRKRQPEDLS